MIKIVIHISIGVGLLLLGLLTYFLTKKNKKDFASKKSFANYFKEIIPIIFFVSALLVIIFAFV